eukprot:CAMPEP_0202897766 /NCGR_PEP_ID=MMETSP1392-20130828/6450_1 /ASSEMBLY_ACC=CAM_ASM_000868 /TAXON_ID=225041 /ORGANISM="Chlamydomonas chlamydogama, Strain SAG 11-48b" /LENGTH=307 /DNA_ID=CAMNT_0049583505 /DNA_START=282 /DNA_END=1202 /DNA_ORIENTATION=+
MSWPSCPEWITNYAKFHRQSLQKPVAEQRFMLFYCNKSASHCPGLGDRLRGMEEVFKLAQYTNRTVLFQWTFPEPLEVVFSPAGNIDWRVMPQYGQQVMKNVSLRWNTLEPVPKEISSNALTNTLGKVPTIVVTTNVYDPMGEKLPGEPLGHFISNQRSCILHELFKPSELLRTHVLDMRKKLFGSTAVKYVAVHLRLGGLTGEMWAIDRFDHFQGLMAAMSCARDLAAAHNVTSPVLLLTDNVVLRQHVHEGMFKNFITTPYHASHAGKSGPQDTMLTSFTDLLLLSQATCLVGSPSGFSYVALDW